jgi:hypothetical protein
MSAAVSAALAGIAAASVAVLTVMGGVLLTYYASVWGARKVYRYLVMPPKQKSVYGRW